MTCFAAPLVRESKGHFDSLEIPRNVKKKEKKIVQEKTLTELLR